MPQFLLEGSVLAHRLLAEAPFGPPGGFGGGGGWFEEMPWLKDCLALLLGLGLIGLLVYFLRPTRSATGFVIRVDEEDITFSGQFPANMEPMVADFLRADCQIPGSYQVRGRWEDRVLIVVVQGETARPLEQRIRNFLKLNLKPPRT